MILFEKKNKHGEFQDILGQSIDTGDKFLNKKLNASLAYGKGGGGQAPQDVPKTLRPYVTEVLDRAGDIYAPGKGYVPYQGERIVDFSAPEVEAQQGIQGIVNKCRYLLCTSFRIARTSRTNGPASCSRYYNGGNPRTYVSLSAGSYRHR
jgi:hypothetical protein